MSDMLQLAEDLTGIVDIDTEGEFKRFWEGTAAGQFLIQKCGSCGHAQFYPRPYCLECGAPEPEWVAASGKGTLHTFSIVRQNAAKPFKNMLPYAVAVIDLEEGPRVMGNITDCAVADVKIGMPLEVYFVEAKDGLFIPYWRPTTG